GEYPTSELYDSKLTVLITNLLNVIHNRTNIIQPLTKTVLLNYSTSCRGPALNIWRWTTTLTQQKRKNERMCVHKQ
ncbi:hypothetical protein RN001_001554, partial [Aquatica leii]